MIILFLFYFNILINLIWCEAPTRWDISDCPSSWNLVANISGLLVQTHFAFDPPILQPTTFRNVGGFQIEERRNIKMAKVSTESMAQRNKYCFM